MSKNASRSQKSAAATKAEKIVGLLRRNNRATIVELAKATGWQDHSIRGFMSDTLKRRQGAVVRSSQKEGKSRRYFMDRGKG